LQCFLRKKQLCSIVHTKVAVLFAEKSSLALYIYVYVRLLQCFLRKNMLHSTYKR
jgi:hypothetical protein